MGVKGYAIPLSFPPGNAVLMRDKAQKRHNTEGGDTIAYYIRADTTLPAYLPYPRFLLKMEISQKMCIRDSYMPAEPFQNRGASKKGQRGRTPCFWSGSVGLPFSLIPLLSNISTCSKIHLMPSTVRKFIVPFGPFFILMEQMPFH